MFPQTRTEIAAIDSLTGLATWLIRCPDATIVQECGTLHAEIARRDFIEAARFVDARRAAAWCHRLADLSLPQSVVLPVFATRGLMLEAAKARDGGAA
jgi:hypothetical protein